jgi:tetratricopeptide (TPR) repeat protein
MAAAKQQLEKLKATLGFTNMSSDKEQINESVTLAGNHPVNLIADSDLANPSQSNDDRSFSEVVAIPEASDLIRQGVEKLNRGEDRAAIEDFNQALRLNPDLAEAYTYRGTIRHGKGDHLGALQDYNQALRINPRNAEVYSSRGIARAALGDGLGAIQDYNQAIEIDSNCAKAYLNRSLIRVELEDYQGALADCNQVLKIDPNQAEAYLNRGCTRMELQDYQEAMQDFNQALQINPNLAEAYFNRGVNKISLGDYQEAIADFNEAIRSNPNYAQAYLNRGYTRIQLGDHWGSIQDFDQALRIAPASASEFFKQIAHTLHDEQEPIEDENQQLIKGLIVQGNLRYALEDYQAAIEAYTEVLNLDPNNMEAYNRRSTARSALRDYKGAMEDLEKVKNLSLSNQPSSQITPVSTVEVSAKDYHHRGLEKLQKEDFQGAIDNFNAVLQMNGNDATILTCRGFAYHRLGDNQKSIEDFLTAAKIFYEQGDVKSYQEILDTLKKLQQ